MSINHPLSFIHHGYRLRIFFGFLGLTILFFGVFYVLDQPLRTSAAQGGIVSFELAGSIEKSSLIIGSWDEIARYNAAFGLGFDFLFMLVYAVTLSMSLLLVEHRRKGVWIILARLLGWLAIAAVFFDAVENIALFSLLQGNNLPELPILASTCAQVKFAFILIGLFFSLAGWLFPEQVGP